MNNEIRDDERAIDRALERWVRERSGSELLARAAFAASVAEGRGHACAALREYATFAAGDLAGLRAHAWVGAGDAATPFVLGGNGYFYTLRNWRHEALLAEALRTRAQARALPLTAQQLASDIAELFAGDDANATRWQRAAVAAAPGARIFALTGGPGTGKTSTVVRLLLELLRHAVACGLPERPSIALAAPTGKAAQRLAQAIAHGKQRLRERLARDSVFRELLDAIPHERAGTLHRLLGFRPHDNGFARGPSDPLGADIVVVDEASMIDLAMMRTLVMALKPQACLILLGDPGQLAAVEAGSVLADIAASVPDNALPASLARRLDGVIDAPSTIDATAPLAGHVITLTHGWRAGGSLQRGLQALRAGDAAWLNALFASDTDDDLQLCTCANVDELRQRIEAWLAVHAELYAQLPAAIEPDTALARLRSAQILCALREGAFGAQGINALIERHLQVRGWYHGRPVLIRQNDYARGLFNGDIGIALDGTDGLRVWFQTSRRHGGTALRSFSPRALPEHETAWAITIHRSQGSEYGDVAVVLPPDAEHRILSRELVYTAVSRATRRVEIWTTPQALRAAVSRPIRRIGGLRERLV